MNVGTTLVADGQTAHLAQPRECPFDNPAMPTEFLARFNSFASDATLDSPPLQGFAAFVVVVPLVGMQLFRPLSGASPAASQRRNGIDHLFEHHAVVPVGSSQFDSQRDALAVDDEVPFAARLTAIGWVRSHFGAPFLAGWLAESSEALDQSILSAWWRRSSKRWWSFSQTPASCQSRRRRQQVIPEPQPISGGSISQGMPERSTKMIPVRAARSDRRGLPPFGLGGSGGKRGAISSHKSSGSSGFAILPVYQEPRFC